MSSKSLDGASVAAHESALSPSRTERLAFTSYLRVLAIAGVVLIHAMGALAQRGTPGSVDRRVATVLDLAASWAVPVFIMVSGALLLGPSRAEGMGEFYRRRLSRIGIPLVVWHAVYFGWRRWGLGQAIDSHVIVRDVLTTKAYAALYFFWIILGLYLITPVLRAFVAAASRGEVAWFALGAVVWMWAVSAGSRIVVHLHVTSTVWSPSALVLFLPYVGYFLLGHVLREVVLPRRFLLALLVPLLLSEAFLAWAYTRGPGHPRLTLLLTWGYQDLPAAVSAVCVFLLARGLVSPTSRAAHEPWAGRVRRLGELTFGVFLVHLLLIGLLIKAAPGMSTALRSRLDVSLGVWAGALVAAFVVTWIIGRIPLLRRTVGL